MNTLLAWFNSPEWMVVVKTLLHTLWQAGGLALLLWIALRRATTPAARYRLTLGTLAAILGTTLLTWAVLNQSVPEPTAPDFASLTRPTSKPSGVSPAANFGEPSVIAYSTPIPKPAEETRWSGWLALAWLLGSALMLTRAGVQVAGAERLRRSCKPLDDSHITQLLAEAQRALNLTRRIRVAVTDKLTSPAVVGVIVPTLILPLTLLTTLTPEQIRFILLHEIAHIRRGDYFANLFQLFIEALLFFNPAVWWISHQVRREREACCDALAIELSGAPVDYARTLLHVAETVLNPPPAAAPAFSDNQREPSSLTDRVQRMLVPGYRPALRLTWRAMLAAIVVGGTLLFLSAVGARSTVGAVLSPKQSASENDLITTITNTSGEFLLLTNGSLLKLHGTKLIADFIEVNKTTGKVVARGNVRLETTNNIIRGDEFHGSIATNLDPGTMFIWEKVISTVPWTNPLPKGWMFDEGTGQTGKQWFYYRIGEGSLQTNPPATEPLETRTFQADPNMMAQALGWIPKYTSGSGIQTNTMPTNVSVMGQSIRDTFKSIGVDLDPAQGKTYFYKDQSGSLFVRATEKELDSIETYIATNTIPPPQVNIKIRWVEIPKTLVTPAWLNAASNAFLLPLSNPNITMNHLTKSQTADVLERIKRRESIFLLNESQVTTLTERQAQISVSEMKTVVTGINPKALTKPGVTSTNEIPSDFFETESASLGPVFDVLPTVSADEDTVSLHMINTLREFLGYDNDAKEIPTYLNGNKIEIPLPLPKYLVRQMTNTTDVPDGHTLILGNLPATQIAKQPNGELKTTDVTSTQTNLLFILVTPTIIDPAGNRAKPTPFLNR